MKKVKKMLTIVIVVAAVLLVLLGTGFYLIGEQMIKSQIESAAGKALGVIVSIDDMDLSVFRGKIGIEKLTVQNPPGYNHKNLLKLDSGSVTTSIASLMSDTVNIKQIKLDGLDLVIEQKGLTNNLQQVLTNLPKQKESETTVPKTESKKKGKALHINELEITNITVQVKLLPLAGKADTVTLKLAPIKMTDIGSDRKINTAELSTKIIQVIAAGITEKGIGVLPKNIINAVRSGLNKSLGMGKDITGQGRKVIEKGGDIGKTIVEGLEGIFKSGKKEK